MVQPVARSVQVYRREDAVFGVFLCLGSQESDAVRCHPCVLVQQEYGIIAFFQRKAHADVVRLSET